MKIDMSILHKLCVRLCLRAERSVIRWQVPRTHAAHNKRNTSITLSAMTQEERNRCSGPHPMPEVVTSLVRAAGPWSAHTPHGVQTDAEPAPQASLSRFSRHL